MAKPRDSMLALKYLGGLTRSLAICDGPPRLHLQSGLRGGGRAPG